jgi:1-pyrroline-5-carboxylate dehydrogenase
MTLDGAKILKHGSKHWEPRAYRPRQDSHLEHTIVQAEAILRDAAGNFYINDKPTGAIVARQPFGGARHSGTNDKAGFWLNMTRWLSPRTIKETLVPARDWRRPYLEKLP